MMGIGLNGPCIEEEEKEEEEAVGHEQEQEKNNNDKFLYYVRVILINSDNSVGYTYGPIR